MANTMLRSNRQNITFYVLGLFSVLLLIQKGDAYEFRVGGSQGWTVPTDPNAESYNQWAERMRFQIGDTILFVYPADRDSVLHVTMEDYNNCSTATPLEQFADGHTLFNFNQSGHYYFISAARENCLNNEKLVVVVMADRSYRSNTEVPPSPAQAEVPPSPAQAEVPPSPAPAGEESPPPPSGTPAPSGETPRTNGASSVYTSIIGYVGAFIGSSLILVV